MIRPGGYLIFCYVNNQRVTQADPVGQLSSWDVLDLLDGAELLYFRSRASRTGYSEVIVRF